MGLTWTILDRDANEIARLVDRAPGGNVSGGVNVRRTAKIVLNFDDPVVKRSEIYPIARMLNVKLDGTEIFNGPLLKPSFKYSSRTVEIPCIDTGFFLSMSAVNTRKDEEIFPPQPGVDQSDIAMALIDHCRPTASEQAQGIIGHGIVEGNLTPTELRDREYATGDNILEKVEEFTTLVRGFEYDLRPLSGEGGAWAAFDTFERLGTDKQDEVKFEFGWGKETASDFTYDPSGDTVINRSAFTGTAIEGEPQIVGTSDQLESQLALKAILTKVEGRPDTVDPDLLKELSQGVVAANGWPIDFFTVVPALDDGSGYVRDRSGAYVRVQNRNFGIPPRFGPDPDIHQYWQGDTIRAVAKDPAGVGDDLVGRVSDWSITEQDKSGSLLTEITCAPTITLAGVE